MNNQKNTSGTAKLRNLEPKMSVITHLAPPAIMLAGQILEHHLETNDIDLRNKLKDWLISIMKEKNWSAERWAREADISGTTITRFLNSDDPSRTPRYNTVMKLARAAGVPVMQEKPENMIAVIGRDSLLNEVQRRRPDPLDIFTMPPDDYHPSISKFADCRMVKMDNGVFAVLRNRPPKPGKLVVAVDSEHSTVCQYVYAPPVLRSVETAGKTIPLDAPGLQVIGRKVAEFIDHDDDDDQD
jgi:hypothetical protein